VARNSAGAEDRINLTPKGFDVLRFLVDNPGRLVIQEDLLNAVWPGVYVQPRGHKKPDHGDPHSAWRTRGKFALHRNAKGQRVPFRRRDERSHVGRAREGPTAGTRVFAGRTEALRQLVDLLNHAATGDRQAVFIGGEPGIGKTTLVEHFIGQLRSHPDLAVARGYCIEGFAGAEPYYPLFEVLRELCNGPDRTRITRALIGTRSDMGGRDAGPNLWRRADVATRAILDSVGRMVREACCFFEGLASERPAFAGA